MRTIDAHSSKEQDARINYYIRNNYRVNGIKGELFTNKLNAEFHASTLEKQGYDTLVARHYMEQLWWVYAKKI